MRWELTGAGLALQLLWGCAQNTPTVLPPVPPAASSTQQEVGNVPIAPSSPASAAISKPDKASSQASPPSDLQQPAIARPESVSPPEPAAPAQPSPPPAERGEPEQENPPAVAVAKPVPMDPIPSESPQAGPSAEAYVALAQFTTQIEDREPIDAISFLDDRSSEIIFFTDLRGFRGHTLSHRWEYRGEVMAEVPISVDHDRWRAWSSKQLLPVWTGDWTVSVINSEGEVIASETFNYSERP